MMAQLRDRKPCGNMEQCEGGAPSLWEERTRRAPPGGGAAPLEEPGMEVQG